MVCELCIMCGSFIMGRRSWELYNVWELCIMCGSFICIMRGSLVRCAGASYHSGGFVYSVRALYHVGALSWEEGSGIFV